MSFLDNLENNLKALEAREEHDAAAIRRQQEAREAERELALKRAPHAEALRDGPFAGDLIAACRTIGHGMRLMIRPTWLESVLRLEAREKRLELRPTPEGVEAVFFDNGEETAVEPVDLDSDPARLAKRWLE